MEKPPAGDETTQTPRPPRSAFCKAARCSGSRRYRARGTQPSPRGASYEEIPAGRNVSSTEVRGYYVDFSRKTDAPGPPAQLLPAALAQLGLGWFELSLEGHPDAADEALRVCRLLSASAQEADDGLR